jgi:DNA invertase Pin-like site-specific DNA recombinase
MAQGKAFTQEQQNTIIQSLQEYLEMGFSRNRACKMVGLSPVTLHNWIQKDEALGMKIAGWENAINKVVIANLVDAIQKESASEDARKETTKWWAERRMRRDFATKVENENNNNTKLVITFDEAFDETTPETKNDSSEQSEI